LVFSSQDRFVKFPTRLLETLLRRDLSGIQCRIVLWTLRQTAGWNRPSTPFSWYRIAKAIGADRAGVLRAGKLLVKISVLVIEDNELAINGSGRQTLSTREKTMDADGTHPQAEAGFGDQRHRDRRPESSLLRAAKDRYRDIFRTERKIHKKKDKRVAPQEGTHHPAGAARPVEGKYDHVSQH
jgi:phage replication O-like protein O